MTLAGKTIFMSGGSRGIGLAIALRAARDGANIVIAAKTVEPHPTLPGTIHTAAAEIADAGGHCLPLAVDIRDEDAVEAAVAQAVARFGGIDIVVNNASSVRLTGTLATPVKRYDLMHQINGRGTYTVTRACLPHLLKAENPHILAIAPPILTEGKWFRNYAPYAIAKYDMSLFILGWAEEFREAGVAANAIWPRTAIATAAVSHEIGDEAMLQHARKPEIMADAAHIVLTRPARDCTGNFFLDDEILIGAGRGDLSIYDVQPGNRLLSDFFLDPLLGMMAAP